jgi:rSAM/selenodomain-associated transferase 2
LLTIAAQTDIRTLFAGKTMLLTVVIPTLDAADVLPATLAALRDEVARAGAVKGLQVPDIEIVVSDGGSNDGTATIAGGLGARIVTGAKGRGSQLRAGAAVARGEWLLFLHADTRLAQGWAARVAGFVANPANLGQAAAFRFRLDDDRPWARRLEAFVERRSRWLALPTGHQGLLIGRTFYDSLGGYPDLPSMEDVDMIGRIGSERLRVLPIAAVTSAARYQGEGWFKRMMHDALCVGLWLAGVPATRVARLHR